MGKATLEKALEREKQMAVLEEAIKGVDAETKKLTEETQTVIFAKIEFVGSPTLNIAMANPQKERKYWEVWKRGLKTKKETKEFLMGVFGRWKEICDRNGVFAMAKISSVGARIEYALTQEKIDSISKIITPPEKKELIVT